MNHPRPGLRYVDAGELDAKPIKLDGMDVQGIDDHKLGKVDGFIIDTLTARPYYVVVNGGGWFKSKYFLLPIGHAVLDTEQKQLVADITHDRVERFPGFDPSEFEKLTDDDLKRMDDQMYAACCVDTTIEVVAASRYDHPLYRQPNWWDSSFYRPDRVDTTAKDLAGSKK